jgi:transcriptional regulator with XRE-family HTH domain
MRGTPGDKVREHLRILRDLPDPAERRRLREAAGMSQQALADCVGVSRAALSTWERGTREPATDALYAYVEALNAIRGALNSIRED